MAGIIGPFSNVPVSRVPCAASKPMLPRGIEKRISVGILVPCHRVLRKDGGLGGYRWGLPLKERLLIHESR